MRITFMNKAVFYSIVKERLLSRQSSSVVQRGTLHLTTSTIQVCYFMFSAMSYILIIFSRNYVDWSPRLWHLPCPFTQLPPLWSRLSGTLFCGVSDPGSTRRMWWAFTLWSYLSGEHSREWGGQSWLLQKRSQELINGRRLRNTKFYRYLLNWTHDLNKGVLS
jgi:hypothetical protein